MNNIVKKPEVMLPVLPMLGDFLPAMPTITPNDGIIKRFTNELKINYLERISLKKAEIATNNLRAAKDTMETMITMMTFKERYDLSLREIEYKMTMMNGEAYVGTQRCEQEKEKTEQEKIKTKTMCYEMLQTELIYKQQLKEVEGDSTAEDRTE
jgi:hypothetical protein